MHSGIPTQIFGDHGPLACITAPSLAKGIYTFASKKQKSQCRVLSHQAATVSDTISGNVSSMIMSSAASSKIL